jgi:hypothetical protein
MEELVKKRGRAKEWSEWREEARAEVEKAVEQVSKEPVPDPFEERWQATVTPGAVEEVGEE